MSNIPVVRVLHYIPGFNYGGIESRLLDWYRNIDRNKIQFDVLITTDENNSLLNELKLLGSNVYQIPTLNLKSAKSFLNAVKQFFKAHSYYDVVHSHDVTSGYFILREAQKNRIPNRILHSRTTNFNPDEKNILIKEILKKKTQNYANSYFACSVEAGQWAFTKDKLKSNSFKVVNNGIESEKFTYNQQIRYDSRKKLNLTNNFVIGNVARFSTQKNLKFLIEIFNETQKECNSSKLLLVGDGPEEEKIKRYAAELGIIDNIIFVGRRDNVEDYMQAMDVFIAPSLFEGFGTVAIEAQAAGLPTIVSKGFPKSVAITDLLTHMSLQDGSKEWAKKALKLGEKRKRRNTYTEIVEKGFDVKTTANWLQEYYLTSSSNSL